ncbi:hypothetical protein [Haladaptatus sp. NG-SE-30]
MRAPTISAPTGVIKRQWFRWLGVLVLLLNLGFLAIVGVDVLGDGYRLAQFVLGSLSGLLFVLSTVELPWSVEWYRLAGAGYLCFAASYLLTNLATENELWWVAVTVVGTAVFGFMGFDIARGGRHFDIDTDT